MEEFSDAEDETAPNAALLVLLQQITHMVEGTGLELVLNNAHLVADLKNGRQYNAYTDDALRRAGDLELPEEKFRHGIKHTSPECRMRVSITRDG